MTRADYTIVASMLSDINKTLDTEQQLGMFKATVNVFCDRAKQDNADFSKDKFIAAISARP